jgi:membrane-associated phospholipid phosphatase
LIAGWPRRAKPGSASKRRVWLPATSLAVSVAVFVWLSVAVTQGGWVVRLDARVARWVAANMPSAAEWTARVFSGLGSLVCLSLLAAAAVLVCGVRRRWLDAILVAAALIVSQFLVEGLKDAFERPRPTEGSPIPLPDSFSFPSGHAANAVAVFGMIALVLPDQLPGRRRAVLSLVALALAFCVGASRVVLNVHYVSDVAAGFCVGLAILSAGLLSRAAILERRGRRPATRRGAVEGDRGPARLGP